MISLRILRLTIPSDRLTPTTRHTINHLVRRTSRPTSRSSTPSIRNKLTTITRTTLLLTISSLTFTRGQARPRLLRQIPRRHSPTLPITTLRRLTIRSSPTLTSPLRQITLTLRPLTTITTTSTTISLRQQLRLPRRPLPGSTTLTTSHNATLQTLTQLRLRIVQTLQPVVITIKKKRNRQIAPSRRPRRDLRPNQTINTNARHRTAIISPTPIIQRQTLTHTHHCPTHPDTHTTTRTTHQTANTTAKHPRSDWSSVPQTFPPRPQPVGGGVQYFWGWGVLVRFIGSVGVPFAGFPVLAVVFGAWWALFVAVSDAGAAEALVWS